MYTHGYCSVIFWSFLLIMICLDICMLWFTKPYRNTLWYVLYIPLYVITYRTYVTTQYMYFRMDLFMYVQISWYVY